MDYITLVKGDDTNFVDDQYIKIKFVTDLDFTGFTGYFTLGGVTLNYTNISSKVINVVLNNSFTSALTVGKQYAELKLKDPQNRYRTITSVIPIKVVDVVTVQPTYVNNVIECHSDVNNTTIEVKIETAGIAQSTADEYVTTMNSILTQTQSKANEASSSAVNARTSEVNAKSYMDDAKDYKDLANTSAGNAATSATFVEETVNGFDTHVAGKQSDFDSNATSKTDTFNSNATSKTEEFNTNATSKTNDFNTNYNTKKLVIDNAVTQAQRYATGTPSEPDGYSAKYWAERASQGQIQADWTQDDNTKQDYIKNKPTKLSEFEDDITLQSDWSENNDISKAYIKNKPTKLSEFEDDITLQSDFNQTNTESKDFIKNKPRIKTWATTVSTTWVGSESPYTQEITLAGMLATDNVLIALKSNSATSIKDCQKELSKIFFAETLEGKLKLYAKSPTKTAINLLVYESEKE